MLLLIVNKSNAWFWQRSYSNTSYVAINLITRFHIITSNCHSNTSYVAINPNRSFYSFCSKRNSNTSYVAINPTINTFIIVSRKYSNTSYVAINQSLFIIRKKGELIQIHRMLLLIYKARNRYE